MKNILGIFVFFVFIISPLTAFGAGELGVVDNGKILEQYSGAREAQKKVTEANKELQKTFANLTADLETSLQDKNLSQAQKLQKRKEVQDRFEAEKKKLDLMVESTRQEIESKIEKAIQEEAKAEGLSMVLAKNIAFYGGRDITNNVLARLK